MKMRKKKRKRKRRCERSTMITNINDNDTIDNEGREG